MEKTRKAPKQFYEYRLLIYNESTGAEETCRGVTYGRSEAEAMKRICKAYGNCIIEVTLSAVIDDDVYEFVNEPTCLFSSVVATDIKR